MLIYLLRIMRSLYYSLFFICFTFLTNSKSINIKKQYKPSIIKFLPKLSDYNEKR